MSRYWHGAVYQIGHVHRAVIADTEDEARALLLAGRGVLTGTPRMVGEVMNVDHLLPAPIERHAEMLWGREALKEMKGEK